MSVQKKLKVGGKVYISFSIISLVFVGMQSLYSPQSTMDWVGVTLDNTDAISSIRGIYGGVGMVIVILLTYLMLKDYFKGLVFLSLFWGAYAISRLITIWVDGSLGAFGNQWIVIESIMCLVAMLLVVLSKRSQRVV